MSLVWAMGATQPTDSAAQMPPIKVVSGWRALLYGFLPYSFALAATDPAADQPVLDLYLEVTIDGASTHSVVSFKSVQGRLYIQRSDLEMLGVDLRRLDDRAVFFRGHSGMPFEFADAVLPRDPARESIELDLIPNLRFHFDEAHQSIDMELPSELRRSYILGPRVPLAAESASGTGLAFNYDVVLQSYSAYSSAALSSEQRFFAAEGVFSNVGVELLANAQSKYLRESTSYQLDNPESLTSLRVGDTVTSALNWTRSVRLGGLSFATDFALRPGLVTFPTPQLNGSAALPSIVDLYVNDVHQMSSEVPSGPFLISGAAAITGGGIATVIVRDPFGRATSASLPIYVDTRLLTPGLNSYSIEAGLLRYNYGLRSFDYEGEPALNVTYRYGVNEKVTLEGHTEATTDLVNAGAGALWALGPAGVLNCSIIGSAGSTRQRPSPASSSTGWAPLPTVLVSVSPPAGGDSVKTTPTSGNGGELVIGYQLLSPNVSLTAQISRVIVNYTDLAAVGGTPPARRQDQLSVSLPLSKDRQLGASFVRIDDAQVGQSAIGALWYSTRLSSRATAFANISHDVDRVRSTSVSLLISYDFGNRTSGAAQASSIAGRPSYGANWSHSAEYGGGTEWNAQTNRVGDASNSLARVGYLGAFGEVTATALQTAGRSAVSVEATGAVLLMDGTIEASRRIGAGFALISTDGVAGVPVLHENRLLGVTDDSGHLLVPDLNPYEHNAIAIDTLSLPPGDNVLANRLDITPRGDSGVLARFAIKRYAAATITLVDASGSFLPPGTLLRHVESGRDFSIGYDGIAFVEDLEPNNHLLIRTALGLCTVEVGFDRSSAGSDTLPDLGRVTCRLPPVDLP